jgi:hypothetical protein
VKVYTTKDFDRQTDVIVAEAIAGEVPGALPRAKRLQDEFNFLRDLETAPTEDTFTLKRVRQSKRYPVWRVSHPYDPETAVRLICWFDDTSDDVVVALFAGEKMSMGDVFYDSVGSRADATIDEWISERNRQ